MRYARSKIKAGLSILFLLGFCDIFGSAHPGYQNHTIFTIDTIIEDLIFNARYDQAISLADDAIDEVTIDSDHKLRLLLKLSEIYLYKNNPEKTAEILQEVALKKNASETINNRIEFMYSLEKAMLFRVYGKHINAGEWLFKSEFFLKKIKNPEDLDAAKLYTLMGRYYYEKGDSSNAVRYFSKSIKTLSDNSLPGKMAKLTNLSYLQLACLFSGDLKRAGYVEASVDSAYLNTANKYHPYLLRFYLNSAFINLNYNLNSNKARTALYFASAILNKYHSSADDYGLLYCYKGQLAYQERDPAKALGYFRQVDTYIMKNQDLSPYMFLYYFDLANTYYFFENNYHKAIENYKKVIENNNQWMKRAHVNSRVLMGYCYFELGDTTKAISCIKNGIIAAETGSHIYIRDMIYAYRCLAGLYKNIGQEEVAHLYFQKAYEKAQKYDVDWDLKTDIITNLANYHRDKGDIPKALSLYQKAIDIVFYDSTISFSGSQFCDETELIQILNNKSFALLQLYLNQDKNFLHLRDALICQKTAIQLIEKRLGYLDNESSEYNWLELVKTTFNNAVLYATLLYNRTHDPGYAEDGYHFAEKSRMMVILMASRDKNTNKITGVPDSLLQREIRVHNEILNLQNQLYQCERSDLNSADQKLITGKLARVQIENDQLKSFFEINYNRYFNLKYNLNVISLQDLREKLDKNQILLEYQLLEEELIIVAITRDQITMKLIADKGYERESIKKFYRTLSENPSLKEPDKTFKDFTETSFYLYSWLIEPIKEEIANKQLIIIPHSELNLVPFELLISELPASDKAGNYKSLSYIIKKYPISYGYSGTLLYDETKLHSGKTAAFFIPDYSNKINIGQKNFINLKGSRIEVKKARDLIGGDLFSGVKANETQFKKCASKYKILHIAAHTLLDDKIPTLSSIELSADKDTLDDGVLYSYELYQLQMNAQLIVLSGCNTGTGLLRQGEGLLSLSRSFFYSGARSVVFTLWPQADQTGADIMIGFYKGIKNKKSLEEALQTSKLVYLKDADPVKSHPYYWGGYLIVGKTDPVILNNYFSKKAILLVMLCVCVAGISYRQFRSRLHQEFLWLFQSRRSPH
jgi:CHAT domain-containing protein